ncbi:hypothetical protein V4F39_03265 [Aquincola sp. MAHUQ-54]|uniref:Uncharacterized protein n=1 Tax=Aquincola agrisoli TaxID=3119538 RepID=A0AAW9Q1U7_9BURK
MKTERPVPLTPARSEPRPPDADARRPEDTPPGRPRQKDDDGVLESLGKAVTDPLRTAADDDELQTQDRPAR